MRVKNCRLAFGSILKDVIGEEVIRKDSDSDYESQSQDSERLRAESKPNNDFEGFYSEDQKSPSATDFFDINEYADDEVVDNLFFKLF